MFEKSFKEMMAVDVSPYVKERDGADYLGWAMCKKLLHEHGAEEVTFYPVLGHDGCTLRMSRESFVDKNGISNRAYEVLVHIKVDNIEWDITYPVMNGSNPVKDNSMSQQRVHNAVKRAFVKGVAERLGLGFGLWLGEDDDIPMEETEDLSKHNIQKIKQRCQELVTSKINQGIPLNVIADRLGMDEESFKAKFALYNELANFEYKIWEMKP